MRSHTSGGAVFALCLYCQLRRTTTGRSCPRPAVGSIRSPVEMCEPTRCSLRATLTWRWPQSQRSASWCQNISSVLLFGRGLRLPIPLGAEAPRVQPAAHAVGVLGHFPCTDRGYVQLLDAVDGGRLVGQL